MRSFMNLKNRQNTSIRRECYSHMDRRESAKSWKGEKVFLLTTPNNLWRVPRILVLAKGGLSCLQSYRCTRPRCSAVTTA
jgi:hypothetical protein